MNLHTTSAEGLLGLLVFTIILALLAGQAVSFFVDKWHVWRNDRALRRRDDDPPYAI